MIFNIKGQDIKIITSLNGRRAPAPESIPLLMKLTMQYGDQLRTDPESLKMAEYLKDNSTNNN